MDDLIDVHFLAGKKEVRQLLQVVPDDSIFDPIWFGRDFLNSIGKRPAELLQSYLKAHLGTSQDDGLCNLGFKNDNRP